MKTAREEHGKSHFPFFFFFFYREVILKPYLWRQLIPRYYSLLSSILKKSRDRRFRPASAVAISSPERRQIRSTVVINPFIRNYDPSRASTIWTRENAPSFTFKLPTIDTGRRRLYESPWLILTTWNQGRWWSSDRTVAIVTLIHAWIRRGGAEGSEISRTARSTEPRNQVALNRRYER